MTVNLRSLVERLNNETRTALQAATGFCLSRTHYDVEIEHYLSKLLDTPKCDFSIILEHYGVDRARLAVDLTEALDKLKSGNARSPSLSPSLVKMLSEAWLIGSFEHDGTTIRTGFTIEALAANEELGRFIRATSAEIAKISAEDLRKNFHSILATSPEDKTSVGETSDEPKRKSGGTTPNLEQFTVNLTKRAKDGEIDPVLGRDFEVRQLIDILMRRRQNNPILVGDPGTGKTAIVEGFATRIADGDVPPPLQNVVIHTLDLALLQAGAGVKGEFENRLKGLIEEVRSSPTPIVLFIDEAHTMIGAGGQAGQGDAANLLKPALARGELRTIAATTWAEYKQYFEKDPALARRFQLVGVSEPTEEVCALMMRGVVPALEGHHNVRILDSGLLAAVRFSNRYLPDRKLPDKAVSVLDTACARLALRQNAKPAPLEDASRQLDDLEVQRRVLERESAVGTDHSDRLDQIAQAIEETTVELQAIKERWEQEADLVTQVRETRRKLESTVDGNGSDASLKKLRKELTVLNEKLENLQGEDPLVPVCVDAELVGQVISAWTGVPVGKMMSDEVETSLKLEEHLAQRIIGQGHALEFISRRLRTSRAGMDDPGKPVGVFLLAGPSGCGKTETALALSDLLYGGEGNVITINMSEFQDPSSVTTLKGSPRGYVGYGKGGVLTEAVRRRPYSVVLLDEVEKAHPDVLEVFYQVFDKGVMEDSDGIKIDFKNTLILLTTNAASETMMKLCADPDTLPAPEGFVNAIKPELNEVFQPAFLGRTVIIPYYPLGDEVLRNITNLKLEKIRRRLLETHKATLDVSDAVIDAVVARCTEVESGARNVDNILTNTMLPEVSRILLQAVAADEKAEVIRIGLTDAGDFEYVAETITNIRTSRATPALA